MGTSGTSTSGHELALVPEDRQAAHHSHHRARSLSLEKAADWGLKELQELFSTLLWYSYPPRENIFQILICKTSNRDTIRMCAVPGFGWDHYPTRVWPNPPPIGLKRFIKTKRIRQRLNDESPLLHLSVLSHQVLYNYLNNNSLLNIQLHALFACGLFFCNSKNKRAPSNLILHLKM